MSMVLDAIPSFKIGAGVLAALKLIIEVLV
ncbi:hypothetical protein JOD45_002557 [Scopulibacillus daqui]|uniref:Uncharacterized protein n=1 Tax=Scopulibacillus daqui TaxID=1469162 RepID=A0ABS2Q232_9BACL|nr:hypothetical protein [Scopulibacillus daqui]